MEQIKNVILDFGIFFPPGKADSAATSVYSDTCLCCGIGEREREFDRKRTRERGRERIREKERIRERETEGKASKLAVKYNSAATYIETELNISKIIQLPSGG